MAKRIPQWRYPTRAERVYQVYLTRVVNQWEAVVKTQFLPALESIVDLAYVVRPEEATNIKSDSFLPEKRVRLDNWVETLGALTEDLKITLNEIPVDNGESIAKSIGMSVNEFNEKEWIKITKSVFTIPLFQTNGWLIETIDSYSQENASLITKLRNETIDDINGIVNRGIKEGKRVETISKEILNGTKLTAGRFKKTKTRARLIARDQVAKLNGQLIQLRETEAGITNYIWRTVADERVRHSHQVMNGKFCKWDNATVYKNSAFKKEKWKSRSNIGGINKHPGQDFQCRCYAEADFSTILRE